MNEVHSSNFEIIEGSANSHVILHVPHSSREIPEDIRRELLLDDWALESELDAMTDTGTELIAYHAAESATVRPWIFRNRLSRLVVDPERFPDDREIMNSIGMGVVYQKTSEGQILRAPDEIRDTELLRRFFAPYSIALERLTKELLGRQGSLTIIDVHSFRIEEHRNSVNKGLRRPQVCLGVDQFHTPDWLQSLAFELFRDLGEVVINEPYAGTYVPLNLYQKDENLSSVMMENREDNLWGAGSTKTSKVLARLIDGIESPK